MIFFVQNVSKRVSNDDAAVMTEAVHQQLANQVAPSRRMVPPSLTFIGKAAPPEKSHVFFISDDPEKGDEGIEGYHDLSPEGYIRGWVFCSPCLDNGARVLEGANAVSTVLSHEAIEAMVDPWANYWVDTGGKLVIDGHTYQQVALEACDPVESDDGNIIEVMGSRVTLSNFVLPEWDNMNFAGPVDYLTSMHPDRAGGVTKPFMRSEGGYVIVRNKIGVEQALFGARYPQWKKELKLYKNRKSRTNKRLYHTGWAKSGVNTMPIMQQFDGQIRGGNFDLKNLNVDLLKNVYLIGLQINGVQDGFFEYWLQNAINYIKDETQLAIFDEVVTDEPHDYFASDFLQYSFIKTSRYPIKSVAQVTAIYPTGNYLFTFPNDWLRVDRNGGQIQIVPSGGSLSQALLGQGGTYLPIIYRNLQYLPFLFHVSYTSGWEPGKVPNQLIDAVCKKASIDILAIVGDMIYGPGVVSRSVSVDGLSQSESFINNGQMGAVFTSRIVQYAKDLWGDPTNKTGGDQDGLIWSLKKEHKGLGLTSLGGAG